MIQDKHVEDIVSSWTETFKENDSVLTPASLNLFAKGGGRLLNKKQ